MKNECNKNGDDKKDGGNLRKTKMEFPTKKLIIEQQKK